ncbi:MAG: hypothetical protein Q4F27_00595, partial [Desulfovibrionaceae bacterium]|nr:hypothetical protein [Desulfovibrionaceae bacterium]
DRKERSSRSRATGMPGTTGPRSAREKAGRNWKKHLGGLKNLAALFCLLAVVLTVLAGVCALSLWLYRTATTSDFLPPGMWT